ncbi:LytR C-terminal domain-containing protein [Massilia litorea]|uniref:Tetratricopeptide repeat protein n=1 Tax=Massilia litorea TaxID=2769491 RepID=A0A7L9U9M7_9BURK|nr:LytR C-terminal domain-containing protein [Massilia litorea]QOL51761.1 tetratricopeptide repeat protein [Massilia litorea]
MPIRPLAPALVAALLLSSCAGVPPQLRMMFQPAEQVRHGSSDVASAYYRLGRYHQDAGDLGLALTAYTYASARDPKAPEPRIAAAAIHAQQGRLAQARAMLRQVCAEYPALAQPLNNLGYVYYLEGDYEAATQAFRAALAREPGSERARNNLRLAEGAAVRGVAALETIAALPAPPVPPAPEPVPAPAPAAAPAMADNGMQLVRTAPNVYELRAAPAVAASAPVRAAAPAPAAAQFEIANGHGADGLARRFQQSLALRGIVATRLTNMTPFNQAATRIDYAPGQEAAARRLQAALGGKPILRLADRGAVPGGMRLVLGKDAPLALAQAKPLLATSAAPVSTHPMQ